MHASLDPPSILNEGKCLTVFQLHLRRRRVGTSAADGWRCGNTGPLLTTTGSAASTLQAFLRKPLAAADKSAVWARSVNKGRQSLPAREAQQRAL
ncbi:hypothetical protein MTO96_003355 [Rhipicephalus appendiculatus]